MALLGLLPTIHSNVVAIPWHPRMRQRSPLQPKRLHNGCSVDELVAAMAKSLTLKNLPDALHARLSAAARQHRRSLNSEAIVCLEAGLTLAPAGAEERLTAIRALRETLPRNGFAPADSDAFKREGRP
ncbi:FitA-like ribbon-helix-helix domain-containing protein [Cyanobium sp. ULC082]